MSLDERISELIKRIYCAGTDPRAWDAVTLEVLQVTGAHAALTSVTDLKSRDLTSYRAYGPEDSRFARGIEEYSERHAEDPSLRWGFENPGARFCASADTLPSDGYLANDYVRWNRDRFGSNYWYVGYTPPADELSFTLSLHFPAAEGAADEGSIRLFRMLFDHMECAVRLRRRPFNVNSPKALLLLDAEAKVKQMTGAAERMLGGVAALQVIARRLVTAVHSEQPKLDRALATVASAIRSGSTPVAVRIEHPSASRAWLLTIRPLVERFGPFGNVRCELLLEIHDSIPRIGSLQIMQSLFNLSARELELVRLLADGHSVESLAECMSISVNTARSHLRSIFAKTDTVRQSQLLQLCAGLQQP